MIHNILESEIKLPFEIGFEGLMEDFLPLEEHFNFPWLMLADIDKENKHSASILRLSYLLMTTVHAVGFLLHSIAK